MRVGTVTLVMLLMLGAGPAGAQPKLLSDQEMDEITAQGVQVDVNVNPGDQTVDFAFNLGSTFGNGTVTMAPGQAQAAPGSGLAFTNAPNFSNAVFHVDNMIFNLNICAGCQAGTIIQKGIGVPITINALP